MTNEEAIKKMQAVKAYMTAGNPIWSVIEMGEVFDMAIEALENNDKLAEDLQSCLEMYKKKKAEVEALKQTQWIPCSERLPEQSGFYLTTVNWYGYLSCSIKHFNGKDFVVSTTETEDITAWMPLPEPYKEEG